MPAKKKTTKKRASKRKVAKKSTSVVFKTDKNIVNKLVKNNLELQKTSLKLIEASNKLVGRIDKLVGLFEEAAKNVNVVDDLKMKEETKPLYERLDELLQQNRDLARGLLLLEQYIRGRTTGPPRRELRPKPLPPI